MATWPNIVEMRAYIGEVNDDQLLVLSETLDSAIAYIGWRCEDQLESQTTGDYDEIVPANIRQATMLQTSRWFRRRLSPEGVAGFGEFGAVRVTRLDPDIETMITPQVSWGIA